MTVYDVFPDDIYIATDSLGENVYPTQLPLALRIEIVFYLKLQGRAIKLAAAGDPVDDFALSILWALGVREFRSDLGLWRFTEESGEWEFWGNPDF